ncbi:hypothetical protein SAMN05660748_0164 [Blastococcus aggregatus]|uniref:Uncharacterized protein n=1 Tax=Blastococcus aggregatus TaxID=38502 RepID=A0A285UZY4_9ACTN|nr:hypothetical protein [Blastococcus aggregatus]SOC46306.1 hypothetical protein SAMN05660748_0164 [Blastococcus aggregatus]
MAARGWTALFLLAAVFALHGLQCTAAGTDHAAGHGVVTGTLAPAGLLGGGALTSATATPADAHGAHADPLATIVAAAPTAGLLAAGHGSTPVGPGGHLWTLCLAVLAAGLAVLLVSLLPRTPALPGPPRARLRTRLPTGLAPLQPPDLHALCLLRT